jgi:hypothetical protein
MTVTVLVANDGDETAVCDQGRARARRNLHKPMKCGTPLQFWRWARLVQGRPMPLSTQQEALCQHLEKQPEPTSSAAALIRQLAREIDDLWDRLSHVYAFVRRESPDDLFQKEMEQLRTELERKRENSKSIAPESPV